jgi:hypothetical protein
MDPRENKRNNKAVDTKLEERCHEVAVEYYRIKMLRRENLRTKKAAAECVASLIPITN